MSEVMVINLNQTPAASSSGFLAKTKTAIDAGIADARAAVEDTWPKITEMVGKGVYNSAYGFAFGLTFPVVLLAKSIPQNNSIVWGFVDGSRAARKSCDRSFKK
ncbi:MAG: hypothetical protein NTW75_06060 [Planctomycetales bacterium]|jgi:hypothetical protein|nr:hypothetical protein [Planctomycetales bacterium]